MAKALSTGVVQGTKAVGSGVVQGTKAVGSGVVQGTKAVGSGVVVVGSGVVQGSKAVGTGVVQGTKVVGTGVVAAGRMTKDVTIAVGKGVYQASEVVGSAAITGVSAASEATVSAGRVVSSASVSAVMDTTKWVKEQSESFGGDDHEMYTVLPGDTLDDVARIYDIPVYDLIRFNSLHRRCLIPGTQIIIPDETDEINAHPDEIFVAKALMIFHSHDGTTEETEIEGVARFSADKLLFKTSTGSLALDYSPTDVAHLLLTVCETVDSVPELLPAHSIDTDYSNNSSSSSPKEDTVFDLQRQQQQQCHIVEVDLGQETGKRVRTSTERTSSDDVYVILEMSVCVIQTVENGFTVGPDEDNRLEGEASANDNSEAKMHLFKFRFPQADLVAIHYYVELWHGDKLTVSDNFQKHLVLESSFLDDMDNDSGPHILDDSTILEDRQLREIYRNLPHKIQNQSWRMAYSTRVSGFSLQNLYRTLAEEKDPFLIVIQDSNGFIFGSYLTCTPRISENFIGTGKSWLFCFGKVEPVINEEEPASEDEGLGEVGQIVVNPQRLSVYHWSGRNEYFFRGTPDNLIIGAGDGKFGIVVDGDLHKGRIQECDTFEGWPERERDFIISCLECWTFM